MRYVVFLVFLFFSSSLFSIEKMDPSKDNLNLYTSGNADVLSKDNNPILLGEDTKSLIQLLNTRSYTYMAYYYTFNHFFGLSYKVFRDQLKKYVTLNNEDMYCGKYKKSKEDIEVAIRGASNKAGAKRMIDSDLMWLFIWMVEYIYEENTKEREKEDLQYISCIYNTDVAMRIIADGRKQGFYEKFLEYFHKDVKNYYSLNPNKP